jgi:hypothetical protein
MGRSRQLAARRSHSRLSPRCVCKVSKGELQWSSTPHWTSSQVGVLARSTAVLMRPSSACQASDDWFGFHAKQRTRGLMVRCRCLLRRSAGQSSTIAAGSKYPPSIEIDALDWGNAGRCSRPAKHAQTMRPIKTAGFVFYWLRCAVQYPEQRSPPARPLQFPRPESPVSLPEPDAYLSCTVTDARTAPDLAT